MRIDDFKNALSGGGARPNLFRVRGGFPNSVSSILGQAAGAAGLAGGDIGAIVGGIANLAGLGGPARKVEFLCKAASLPGSMLGSIEVPFRGRNLKIPGDRVFQEWQITVINDTDFALHDAFEAWSNAINAIESNVGPEGLGAIQQDWVVEQLGRSGPGIEPRVLKSYTMHGCWVSEVSPIDLSYDSSDQIEEFTVTLQYQYHTTRTTS